MSMILLVQIQSQNFKFLVFVVSRPLEFLLNTCSFLNYDKGEHSQSLMN